MKYALFISSVVISPQSFIVTGSQFGLLLIFLIFGSLLMLFQTNDRRHLAILMLFVFALAMAHSASSLLLTALLLTIMLLQKISYFRLKSYLKVPQLFAATLVCVIWLFFPAEKALERFAREVFVGAMGGATPAAEQIAPRFFELAQVDIFAAVRTPLVYYGADLFLLLLTLGGLAIFLKRLKQLDNTSKFLFLMCGVTLLSMPVAILSKLGLFRVFHLASLFFPFLVGMFILHMCKRRKWPAAVVFSLMILLAPLQLYGCQPLLPSANIFRKDLPVGEPIAYVTYVNSVYQRRMIEFASNHVGGRIACDKTTKNQILGLTDFTYTVAHITGYYPLDKRQLERRYDYFLIHLPGVSGSFNEQAETRTRELILEAIYNSSVIYTNGESYTLTHPPT